MSWCCFRQQHQSAPELIEVENRPLQSYHKLLHKHLPYWPSAELSSHPWRFSSATEQIQWSIIIIINDCIWRYRSNGLVFVFVFVISCAKFSTFNSLLFKYFYFVLCRLASLLICTYVYNFANNYNLVVISLQQHPPIVPCFQCKIFHSDHWEP